MRLNKHLPAMILAYAVVVLLSASAVAGKHGKESKREILPRYDGPLFDAMAQISPKWDMVRAVRRVKAAKVNKVALFARCNTLSGPCESDLLRLQARYPELVILGAPKHMNLQGDLGNSYVKACLEGVREHGYPFVGEVRYTHAKKTHSEGVGDFYLDPLGSNTDKLLRALSDDVPFMMHLEAWAWEHDWPRVSKLWATHSGQKFIVAHMAFGKVRQVEQMLATHPNVYVTISKKLGKREGFADKSKQNLLGSGMLDKHDRLKPKWRNLLVRYSDRMLFATDVHKPHSWEKYERKVDRYRVLAAQLPKNVAEAISYRNAESLYGVSVFGRD